MYLHLRTGLAILFCLAATACAEDSAGLARPNAIIVGEFALNQAAITLENSRVYERIPATTTEWGSKKKRISSRARRERLGFFRSQN